MTLREWFDFLIYALGAVTAVALCGYGATALFRRCRAVVRRDGWGALIVITVARTVMVFLAVITVSFLTSLAGGRRK